MGPRELHRPGDVCCRGSRAVGNGISEDVYLLLVGHIITHLRTSYLLTYFPTYLLLYFLLTPYTLIFLLTTYLLTYTIKDLL